MRGGGRKKAGERNEMERRNRRDGSEKMKWRRGMGEWGKVLEGRGEGWGRKREERERRGGRQKEKAGLIVRGKEEERRGEIGKKGNNGWIKWKREREEEGKEVVDVDGGRVGQQEGENEDKGRER